MKQPTPDQKKQFQDALQALQGNQPGLAATLFEELCKSHPDQPDLWYMQSLAHGKTGDIRAVVKCTETALVLNPHHTGALTNLANAQVMLGEAEEALKNYKHALEKSPEDSNILNNYGRALSMLGHREDAIELYSRVLTTSPGDAFAHASLADAYCADGRPKEAWKEYARALELDPGMVMAHLGMGNLYVSFGQHNLVKHHFKKAIEIEPKCLPAYIGLAQNVLTEGNHQQALDYIKQAESFDQGRDPMIRSIKAGIFERLGELDKAYEIIDSLEFMSTHTLKVFTKICARFDACNEALLKIGQMLDLPSVGAMEKQQLRYTAADLLDKLTRYDEAFEYYKAANDTIVRHYHGEDHHHQMANEFITHFSKEAMAILPRASTGTRRPIFILGMPRSGTSLTEQILASHPSVFGAGELGYIRETGGKIIKQYTQPNEIKDLLSYAPLVSNLEQEDVTELANWYLEQIGKLDNDAKYVTDKLPGNFLHLGLIALLFPDAPIIHCRRHPVDTCLSIYFQNLLWTHDYAGELCHIGNYYKKYNRLMQHWEQVIDNPMMAIHYEETVENPEQIARNMLDFCNLEWNDAVMDFHKSNRVVHTASYNQVRQPMYKTSRARWKNYAPHISELTELLSDEVMAYENELAEITTAK